MVDSSGPGIPRRCNTVGLADLGDTEGFGRPGVNGTLYGLQLKDGVYERKEVLEPGLFGNLSDVDLSDVVPYHRYYLVQSPEGKWSTHPVIKWDLDVEAAPPHLLLGRKHAIKKLLSHGQIQAAYNPSRVGNLVLKRTPDYVIGPKGPKKQQLSLVSEFSEDYDRLKKPPEGAFIYIEVYLENRPTDYVSVIPGVEIKWEAIHANTVVGIAIIVSSARTEYESSMTVEGIQIQKGALALTQLYVGGGVLFKRMMYSENRIPKHYITAISHS